MLSSKSSSAIASEVRYVPTDGDVNSEPPAQSSQKKKASKAKKRSVPLEEAPSSTDAYEVAAKKKKKKKDNKKRSREEASVEPLETSTAAGDDDAGKHDPTDSTRGSSEERPKKKSKKTTAEDDGTPAPECDGSMNYLVKKYDSTLKQTMIQLGASEKLARTRLGVIERNALREKARLERLVASLEKEKAELEGERDAVVGTLVKERERLRNSRIQEVTRERVKVQTAMADKSTRCFGRVKDYLDRLNVLEKAKSLYGRRRSGDEPMIDITSALSKRITVPEGTAVEECPDKNDPEVGGNAIQEETGDVAAEDPVLVSSSEEREDDEGGD
ncbi:hypothetical protein Bca52824_052895 [Brassica carinata]|uniref:Uncharacterized protein n=1 Tax=Brassica carinata TaxID=52824 RepID=A0A8X7R474_BRACI|nr:hypothetical protein Bca52824_052895 [Brassica carinata]